MNILLYPVVMLPNKNLSMGEKKGDLQCLHESINNAQFIKEN